MMIFCPRAVFVRSHITIVMNKTEKIEPSCIFAYEFGPLFDPIFTAVTSWSLNGVVSRHKRVVSLACNVVIL